MRIPTTGTTDEIARWVWASLVPKSGQCDTVQGELLRAAENLSHEARNNGNANWDEGFERFLDFLEDQLGKSRAITPTVRAEFLQDIARLRDYDNPYMEDDLYDRLTEAVVAYCRAFPDVISRVHDPEQRR